MPAGGLLGAALLALVAYAAFAQGGVRQPAEARLQIATAALAAVAAGLWIWSGSLRLHARRPIWIALGLLVAYAAWCGLSVLWSVAPNNSWIELNRYLEYALVLLLAIATGASATRALDLIGAGFAAIALLVCLYALAEKVLPGLHLFPLAQSAALSRLQEPFGYWNALALFAVLGVPCALALVADHTRGRRSRLAALGGLEVMFLVIAFTYSRGGLLALAVALAALVALCAKGLRALLWLIAGALATLAPLLYGLLDHSLNASRSSLGAREAAGALLGVLIVLSLGILLAGGSQAMALERRITITSDRRRAIARGLLALAAGALAVFVIAIAFSARGFAGTFSHAWQSFTSPRAVSQTSPGRLLSVDSEYRWGWWKEAAAAFSARPLAGWGAGSFPVIHLLYRQNGLEVMQPHSVPLQWLAETGVVGALLIVCASLTLLAGCTQAVRRLAPGRRRLMAAAMVAAGAAYAVHACFDWDADIPGVTLPLLLLLGVVAGAAGTREDHRARAGRIAPERDRSPRLSLSGRRAGEPPAHRRLVSARAGALLAATVALCSFGLSAALPSIAASDAIGALTAPVARGREGLANAMALAFAADRLDPLSDGGPRSQATIAIREGRLTRARDELLIAVERQPSDRTAWSELASVELYLREFSAAYRAAVRAIDLDPNGWRDPQDATFRAAASEAQTALLLQAPPQASATHMATPAAGLGGRGP